jgi:uncharacterized membrane protein YciS (DUF1049 family)
MTGKNRATLSAIKRVVAALAVVLTPVAIGAQSCAMCYQSAAASGPRTIHALNSGILILMFPPALITMGIFYLGYKKRNTFNETE